MTIVAIPALALAIGLLGLSICLVKKYPKWRACVEKVKKTIFFTLIITVIYTGFLPMCVASGLGKNWCIICEKEYETNLP